MLLDRLSSANCLQANLWASFRRFFLLGLRPCKLTCCSVWRMVWALTSWPSILQSLKQCWQHSCFCFLKPASAPDSQHEDLTIRLTLARPVPSGTHLGKPLYDTGHCTVIQFQGITELLIALAFFVESNNSNSQIFREFFGMMRNVEHPVVSMRELYSKNQILTALIQDTQIYLYAPVKQKKTWTWWIGHVALHG